MSISKLPEQNSPKKKKIKKNRRLERPETIIEAPSSLLLEIKALNNYKEENRGMH
jgi:hypothetical protein